MSHYSNCHTTTCHIIPINTWTHVTFFQYLQCHISHYSNSYTVTCHIIPIVTRPHVTLFQFYTTISHFISIVTLPHVTLFQLTHDHTSHNSNSYTKICHITLNVTRTLVTLFQLTQTTYHIIQINTRPHSTLFQFSQEHVTFQLSHDHMSHFTNGYTSKSLYFNCYTTTYHIIPIVTLHNVTLFQ